MEEAKQSLHFCIYYRATQTTAELEAHIKITRVLCHRRPSILFSSNNKSAPGESGGPAPFAQGLGRSPAHLCIG